jgi:hypothetical protein
MTDRYGLLRAERSPALQRGRTFVHQASENQAESNGQTDPRSNDLQNNHSSSSSCGSFRVHYDQLGRMSVNHTSEATCPKRDLAAKGHDSSQGMEAR